MENNTVWRKSSYSGDQGGNCVEVAELQEAAVAIRDSKNTTGPTLTFEPAVFSAFLSGLTSADWS
ncbi:DUF397 domain-containing protein [Streptomyces sp. NPDC001480]|uniref:DUF397 domain-containing protein n=1 Tax=Streptomyces sp. NPDC001480 TaxID=3364577 RepID=UPI003696D4BE